MKKIVILSLSIIGLTMMSFKDSENTKLTSGKIGKLSYTFTFHTGHLSTDCKGIGERCLNLTDFTTYPCHWPCWGEGGDCTHSATIEIGFNQITKKIEIVTMDLLNEADVEILNMPSRSFEIQNEAGNNVFLNIPKQFVQVNNFSPQINVLYILNDCTVSNTPQYSQK